ncbi:MAG: hypothetical protein G01um1014107_109, partial [Parcubacteria group bacterium Gr01-1014_107]
MKRMGQKLIGVTLIAVLALPIVSLYPKKASAQLFVPVHDALFEFALLTELEFIFYNPLDGVAHSLLQTSIATAADTVKEIGPVPLINPLGAAAAASGIGLGPLSIDGIARTLANIFVNQIVNQTVAWIDDGFAGQPGFLRDPGEFFLDLADTVAGDFIDNTPWGFLCEPFSVDIKFALNYRYSSTFEERVTCTLSDVIGNFENFVSGDFINQGGWDGWFRAIQPHNNPYGSYLAAEAELGVRIASRKSIELAELNWGGGLLSFQKCKDP